MIKKIIFDIDNTLIDFPNCYEEEYSKVINKMNCNFTSKELYNAIGKYETSGKYKYYEKEEMLKLINSELNSNLNIDFIDEFFEMYNNLTSDVPNSIKDTLEYLSQKYELVALSNWFEENQVNRMKKVGILKYFKKVYGTDMVPMKPQKESFLSVIENLKFDECLMIGDNLEIDIKIPYELGMNVLFLNRKGIKTTYPSINNIEDLKEML